MSKDEFILMLLSRKKDIEWEYAKAISDIPPTFTTKYTHLKLIEKEIPYRVQLNIIKEHLHPTPRYYLCVHSESSFLGLIEESDLVNKDLLRQLYQETSTLLDQELDNIANAPMWVD